MGDRTGLGPLELRVLGVIEELGGRPGQRYRRSTEVLDVLDAEHGLGSRYAYPLLQDLAVPWRLHLPLLDRNGNWGSQGDPAADAKYTEVRLSPVGQLALRAERGELGPVPLGLIEGSLYRDGPAPPFAPRAVLEAVSSGSADCGPPSLPTGGRVSGDIGALLAGRPTRLELGCTIVGEHHRRGDRWQLVITEVPLGVSTDQVAHQLAGRVRRQPRTHRTSGEPLVPPLEATPVIGVVDETSGRAGVRIVCEPAPGVDLVEAEVWVRSVWPVTTLVDCRLPAPMAALLDAYRTEDTSGCDALAALLP